MIPFKRLHRAYRGRGLAQTLAGVGEPGEQIRYTVEFVESVTGLEHIGAYLTALLELDGLFLNDGVMDRYLCTGFHEAIISDEIFQAVQREKLNRTKNSESTVAVNLTF